MIALLRGTLVEKNPNQAILETGGVGYDVIIPISTFSKLPDVGSETKLRIHTHVREDTLALYGFLTADEKNLFEKLIGVSGIGPGLAVKVLSGMAAADLLAAIRRNDAATSAAASFQMFTMPVASVRVVVASISSSTSASEPSGEPPTHTVP